MIERHRGRLAGKVEGMATRKNEDTTVRSDGVCRRFRTQFAGPSIAEVQVVLDGP